MEVELLYGKHAECRVIKYLDGALQVYETVLDRRFLKSLLYGSPGAYQDRERKKNTGKVDRTSRRRDEVLTFVCNEYGQPASF